jgi:hypothetical protein
MTALRISCNTRLASAAGSFSDDANAKAGAMSQSIPKASATSSPNPPGTVAEGERQARSPWSAVVAATDRTPLVVRVLWT